MVSRAAILHLHRAMAHAELLEWDKSLAQMKCAIHDCEKAIQLMEVEP